MSQEVQAQEIGVQETLELLAGVNELAIALIPLLKDGVQVGDAMSLIEKMKSDQNFKEKLEAAYKGVNQVPAEVKDISFKEGVEIVMLQASYVPKILEAVKA